MWDDDTYHHGPRSNAPRRLARVFWLVAYDDDDNNNKYGSVIFPKDNNYIFKNIFACHKKTTLIHYNRSYLKPVQVQINRAIDHIFCANWSNSNIKNSNQIHTRRVEDHIFFKYLGFLFYTIGWSCDYTKWCFSNSNLPFFTSFNYSADFFFLM